MLQTIKIFILLIALNINCFKTNAAAFKDDVVYHFPSPSEVIYYIKESKLPFKQGFCNLPNNQDKYIEKSKQAVNLGIYMADFAYYTVFNETTTGMQYLGAMQALGYKLRINFNMGKDILSRYAGKKIPADSLIYQADQVFGGMMSYCEQNNLSDVFSLIVLGGYVECLYLTSNYVGQFTEGNPMVQKIADQKFIFDNFANYLNGLEKKMPSSYLEDVNRLKIFYSKLPVVNQKVKATKANGRIVITGGTKYMLDAQKFDELKQLIGEIRSRYVGVEF